jgi:hypothetical protein
MSVTCRVADNGVTRRGAMNEYSTGCNGGDVGIDCYFIITNISNMLPQHSNGNGQSMMKLPLVVIMKLKGVAIVVEPH